MSKNNGLKSFALVAAVFLVLSWLRLDPGSNGEQISANRDRGGNSSTSEEVDDSEEEIANDPSSPTGGRTGGRTTSGGGRSSGDGAGVPTAREGLECNRAKNGGETDTGVSASKIRLATTAVQDGTAKSLLEDSPVAMKAVIDKVNNAGGICGRLLDLRVVNDGFDAARGRQYIQNFIEEGYFALPVVPSAEGLGQAILNGEISKAGIPVIGTDGMRKEQYTEANVWPVASATVTAMRVMAKYGYENRNARSFAIVYDDKYKFGKEGKDAFVAQVQAMGGGIKEPIALDPDSPNYSAKIQTFNGLCGDEDNPLCDMVALLLLPETATKWLKGNPTRALRYTAGAQTLFSDRFAQDCVLQYGSKCDSFAVWTGYNPPIGPLASLPGVAAYVNDVRSVKSNVDVTNQFVEGAYLGMSVFVEALKKVGPDLTRERLKAVMDSMTYTSDLTSTLTWAPGKHSANCKSQSFAMTVSGGTFRGWRNEGTGFLPDPSCGS